MVNYHQNKNPCLLHKFLSLIRYFTKPSSFLHYFDIIENSNFVWIQSKRVNEKPFTLHSQIINKNVILIHSHKFTPTHSCTLKIYLIQSKYLIPWIFWNKHAAVAFSDADNHAKHGSLQIKRSNLVVFLHSQIFIPVRYKTRTFYGHNHWL